MTPTPPFSHISPLQSIHHIIFVIGKHGLEPIIPTLILLFVQEYGPNKLNPNLGSGAGLDDPNKSEGSSI